MSKPEGAPASSPSCFWRLRSRKMGESFGVVEKCPADMGRGSNPGVKGVDVPRKGATGVSTRRGHNEIASGARTAESVRGQPLRGTRAARKCIHNIQRRVRGREHGKCVFAYISRNGNSPSPLFFSPSRSLSVLLPWAGNIPEWVHTVKKRTQSRISQIPSSMIPLITDGNVDALSKCSPVYS